MDKYQKRKAVLYRIYGWTWEGVFIGLCHKDGFTGTRETVIRFGKSKEYKQLRLDALGRVLDWADGND